MSISIKTYLKLIRPHQYVKNTFIFLPIFFAGEITDTKLLFNTTMAFIGFSLAASAVYVLNDYLDIEDDRQHPKKKNRPLASGAIGKPRAIGVMGFLAVAAFGLTATLSENAVYILCAYVVMNIAYSFHLKHVAILDVAIIALGFVLRLFVGSAVTRIELSMWIVTMTFLLALFMALAKRRDDVLIYLESGEKMRKVIDGYNLQFLDAAMAIMASVVIVSYTIYTASEEVMERFHTHYLYLTTLFVILGIMRYLKIAFVHLNSGSPTRIILRDRFMQLIILGWLLTFTWILY